jgi:hypothetical protein
VLVMRRKLTRDFDEGKDMSTTILEAILDGLTFNTPRVGTGS